MKDLIFAFMLGSGAVENDAMRLARSIRTFGGEYCFNPIWMFSRKDEADLSEATRQELFSSGARVIPFDMGYEGPSFPFMTYVNAAAIAESMAQGQTRYLVMMATDTLVLQEPSEFLLPAGKSLGACPVHLKLLGSGFDEPINEFWGLIYRLCQVDTERIFSMRTTVDEQLIRAYFNGGLLVVRPERGILRGWQADFEQLYRLPEFDAFYNQNDIYKIFMHQAVLAGSILSSLKQDEFQELPFEMNYPLHLHSRIAPEHRIENLDQLITCRYEDFHEILGNPDIDKFIQVDEPLKEWLQA